MTHANFEPTEKRLFVAFLGISLDNKHSSYTNCDNFAEFLEKEVIPQTKTQIEYCTKKEFPSLDLGCEIPGYSVNLLLSESHCGVHFTPEKNYLSVEISTCGNTLPENALETLLKNINHDRFQCVFDSPTVFDSDNNYRLKGNKFLSSVLSVQDNAEYGFFDEYKSLVDHLNDNHEWGAQPFRIYANGEDRVVMLRVYGKNKQKTF